MSAAPALALVPSTPEPPRPAAPAAGPALRVRRTRAAATAMCVAGALLPLPFVLVGRWIGDWRFLGFALGWPLCLGVGGLALFVVAVTSRTRDDLRAMLLAAAAFAAAVALLPVAARVGTEAYVSSHAAEVDALAARVRAEWRPVPRGGPLDATQQALRAAAAELHLGQPRVVDGGIVFQGGEIFTSGLFRADGAADPAAIPCRGLSAIGGGWYTGECRGGEPEER